MKYGIHGRLQEELEASLKKIRVGDVVTGTVLDVTDDAVIVDLKTYADGVIRKEDLSEDPDFNMAEMIHPGDEITATVMATNDGEGNMVLSKKEANQVLAWDKLKTMMEERTVVPVKISEIVNAGAVAYLEGIRGFIPASRLSDEYVEDLKEFDGKTIEVTVITADEENTPVSYYPDARQRERKSRKRQIKRSQNVKSALFMNGTVETLKDYGAFVELENGLTGLLHISQISTKRIKHPGAVLKEGQNVKVKIISTANNKISLSMKELIEEEAEREAEDTYGYKEEGQASTGLADLLKGLKL